MLPSCCTVFEPPAVCFGVSSFCVHGGIGICVNPQV